jgi:hypothetical protein
MFTIFPPNVHLEFKEFSYSHAPIVKTDIAWNGIKMNTTRNTLLIRFDIPELFAGIADVVL